MFIFINKKKTRPQPTQTDFYYQMVIIISQGIYNVILKRLELIKIKFFICMYF